MSEALPFHATLARGVRRVEYDNYNQFMAECHNKIDELDTAESPLDHLVELDQKYWQPIGNALGRAPHDTLQRYGERALAWTSLHYNSYADPYFADAMAQTSYSVKRLGSAAAWGRNKKRPTLAFAEAQYGLSRRLEEQVKELPVADIITDNLRPGASSKSKSLGAYSLQAVERADISYFGPLHDDDHPFFNHIYLDAPLGIVISYKDIPQAVAGISLSYPTELMAYQIQGIKIPHSQSGRGLGRLDWRGALLDIAERITVESGLAFTGVQAARHNMWVHRDYGKKRRMKHFRQIYDKTAQAHGYWQGKDHNWHIQHAPQTELPK